ncbi:MAG: hypothetical protein ACXADH_03015 [Candidatus Kariarchaeaceae archaeon]|jgi:hypothetical protein
MPKSKRPELPLFKVGTLIQDKNRVGIIYREIKQGTWTDQPLFNWKTNYEIYYDDGSICIMGEDTLLRLIEVKQITILELQK